DTANNYTLGTSEQFLGELMGPHRERLVVATKATMTAKRDNPNAGGNHRKNIVQTVETSLARLKTSYLDLLWIHAWDAITPVEELMRTLDDLVRQGKVVYVGISNAPAWFVAQANTIASLRGWTPFADNLASLDVTLSADQLAQLDEASAIGHGYPADFLARDGVRGSVYGGMRDRIDDPRLG